MAKARTLVEGTPFESASLAEIVIGRDARLFNAAAQAIAAHLAHLVNWEFANQRIAVARKNREEP